MAKRGVHYLWVHGPWLSSESCWLDSWKVRVGDLKIFIGMEWALVGVKGKPVYDREFGHSRVGIFFNLLRLP